MLFEKLKAESADAPTRDAIPSLPSKMIDVKKFIGELDSVRHRVSLSETTLPSICSYTFHQTTGK